jgi:proteic killer suppression protein
MSFLGGYAVRELGRTPSKVLNDGALPRFRGRRRRFWGRQDAHNGLFATVATLDINHAKRYYQFVIKTFKCADTRALANGEWVKRFATIAPIARRKLRQLEIAARLDDLRIPPGNRLEALKGDRVGQHSIRVNDQFRVCFRWTDAGAEDVEIVDYH